MRHFVFIFILLTFTQATPFKQLPLTPIIKPCVTTRIRREIRDLTQTERTAFVTAFALLQTSGNFTDMVKKHANNYDQVHFTPYFLPFHRYFILELESRLAQLLGDDFTLPYWDWSIDSQKPRNSILFTRDYVGSVNPVSFAIDDSPLKGLIYAIPTPHLVTRDGQFTPFVNYATMKQVYMLTNQSFSQFSLGLESEPHPAVHNNIGGDLANHWS